MQYALTYILDEFAPFRLADGRRFETLVFGEATIDYDGPESWRVSAIKLDTFETVASKYVRGSEEITDDHPLWAPIVVALGKDRAQVEESIYEKMASDGVVFINDNGQHSTINHRQQGIAQ